jgi:hypothetical protein
MKPELTKREYIAIEIAKSLSINNIKSTYDSTSNNIAVLSVNIADALIKQLKK